MAVTQTTILFALLGTIGLQICVLTILTPIAIAPVNLEHISLPAPSRLGSLVWRCAILPALE